MSKIKNEMGMQPQNSEETQPSMDSYGTNVPQNDEDREVVNTRHTEKLSPSCHTEERSDVSIHRMGTQPLNSEETQPSLDSYGSNEPQNDEGGEVVNICHTEERSDVSIHRMGTQSRNSEDNTHF